MKEGSSIVERPDPNEWWEKTITIADLFCCGNCKLFRSLGCPHYNPPFGSVYACRYCVNYKFDGLNNKERMIDVD